MSVVSLFSLLPPSTKYQIYLLAIVVICLLNLFYQQQNKCKQLLALFENLSCSKAEFHYAEEIAYFRVLVARTPKTFTVMHKAAFVNLVFV